MTATHWSGRRWRDTWTLFGLLEHGADVSTWSKEKVTPHWYFTSVMRQLAVAQVVLEHGADVKAQGKDRQSLFRWAQREEAPQLLLKNGVDANALGCKWSDIVISGVEKWTCECCSGPSGARRDVNAWGVITVVLLQLAFSPWFRHVDILTLYSCPSGATPISTWDEEGQTPLMRATAKTDHSIMQLLLEYGAVDHRT